MNEDLRSRPVVVALDGVGSSAGALRFAAREAQRHDGALGLVHVIPDMTPVASRVPVPPEHLVAGGRRTLRRAARQVATTAPMLSTDVRLLQGSIAAALVAESGRAGVLVLGRESRASRRARADGSVAAAVAARSSCAVAVVPSGWDPGDVAGPVVVGVEDPERALELMARAFEIASRHALPVRLLHAWKLPGEYDAYVEARAHAAEWERAMAESVEQAAAPFRDVHPGVRVDIAVVHDDPARALVAAGASASMLLLSRPRHRVLGPHLGACARGVLLGARCPAELVPTSTSEPDEWDEIVSEDREVLGC